MEQNEEIKTYRDLQLWYSKLKSDLDTQIILGDFKTAHDTLNEIEMLRNKYGIKCNHAGLLLSLIMADASKIVDLGSLALSNENMAKEFDSAIAQINHYNQLLGRKLKDKT